MRLLDSPAQAKLLASVTCVAWLLSPAVLAGPIVTVTLGPVSPAAKPIPEDFLGLSFGMRNLPPNARGERFFSPSNTALVTLVRNLGVKHLRLGGTSVESPPSTPIPDFADIDNLFLFARTAGVQRIIYSLRLLETNSMLNYAATNAGIAAYIWNHYRPQLDTFSLGNEPDLQRVYHQDFAITNFATYLSKWRRFAAAITNAVSEAKFSGPDAANLAWTTNFAEAQSGSRIVTLINGHFYVGGKGRGVLAEQGIEQMLSSDWLAANQKLYEKVMVPVSAAGFPFRFTEANDHYSGGVPEASNTFAGALWALDFLHWWAVRGASGVDFHNTQWVVNDVITPDASGRLTINPKGCGLKAFELGSSGSPEQLVVDNTDKLNLTAYAVGDGKQYWVTIINKEHGPNAREARVNIVARVPLARAEGIYLTAPNGNVAAKTGVTLGGDQITSTAPWTGRWIPLESVQGNKCILTVSPATAAVIKLLR